jgi:hypothetical protein
MLDRILHRVVGDAGQQCASAHVHAACLGTSHNLLAPQLQSILTAGLHCML